MDTYHTLHDAFYNPAQKAVGRALSALRDAEELAHSVLREGDPESHSYWRAERWLTNHAEDEEDAPSTIFNRRGEKQMPLKADAPDA